MVETMIGGAWKGGGVRRLLAEANSYGRRVIKAVERSSTTYNTSSVQHSAVLLGYKADSIACGWCCS